MNLVLDPLLHPCAALVEEHLDARATVRLDRCREPSGQIGMLGGKGVAEPTHSDGVMHPSPWMPRPRVYPFGSGR
jgi:hypothetical protein